MAFANRSQLALAAALELPASRPSSRASKMSKPSQSAIHEIVAGDDLVLGTSRPQKSPISAEEVQASLQASSATSSISRASTAVNSADGDVIREEAPIPESSTAPVREAEQTYEQYPPEGAPEREMRELPPVDRGFQAWRFLVAASVLDSVVWGLPTSFGVFLAHYLASDLGQQPKAGTLLPLIGSASTGTMYCLSPFVGALMNRHPKAKASTMYVGLSLSFTCLIAASFARTAVQLLIFQGFGYAFGGVLMYYTSMSFMPQWFVARRGFANGVIFAGTGAGGLVYPFVLEGLLSRFSVATTIRAVAVGNVAIIGPCIPFIGPREPAGKASAPRRSTALGDRTALIDVSLWLFLVANTLQGMAWFMPPLYLPTYARSLSKTTTTASGSIVLSALNATSIISRTGIGILSDRYRPHLLGALLMVVSSVVIASLWGGAGATGLPALTVFTALSGVTAGGWTSLYFAVVRECSSDQATTITLYGAMSLTRGLGNLLCAPIGSSLLLRRFSAPQGTGFALDDNAYSSMIVFCAVALGIAGFIEVGLAVFTRHKRRTE